jgi:hypothetical protein
MTRWNAKTTLATLGYLMFVGILLNPVISHANDRDDQIQCAKEGRIFAKQFNEEYTNFITPIAENPEFHFSKKMNTCLALTGVFGIKEEGVKGTFSLRMITDVYSNKILVYTRKMTDTETGKDYYIDLKNVGDAELLNSDDFARAKDVLFGE